MRIGIISDTHISREEQDVPASVYEHFTAVDLILHAGDIYLPVVLDRLGMIAPVLVVAGNGDEDRRIVDERLAETRVFTAGGLRVGLRHSIVFPERAPEWTLEREMDRCFGGPVDIVVIGDTHIPEIAVCKGVLVINPGSATLPRNFRWHPGTIAMLEIIDGIASASIIDLE